MPTEAAATLVHRVYEPRLGPLRVVNAVEQVQFVLPVTAGRMRLTVGGDVAFDGVTQPGMVRIVQPGEQSVIAPAQRFESTVLCVPVSRLPHGARIASAPPVIDTRRELCGLGPVLRAALELDGPSRDLVVDGLATALSALLSEEARPSVRVEALREAEFLAATRFAEARLRTGLGLVEWAAVLELPPREFSRRFQAFAGTTPYAWFLDRRIAEAKRLLATTDLRVIDVALELGFSSQSHFTDLFRSRVGVSPGRWRRRVP